MHSFVQVLPIHAYLLVLSSLFHLRNNDRNVVWLSAIIASLFSLLIPPFETFACLARALEERRVSVAIVALVKGFFSDAVGNGLQVVDFEERDEPVQALLDAFVSQVVEDAVRRQNNDIVDLGVVRLRNRIFHSFVD